MNDPPVLPRARQQSAHAGTTGWGARLRAAPGRVVRPARGDLLAAVTVALVLVPQSLAYAELAGLPVVTGLYTAVAATIAAGIVGSSRYLQTGPVALTSLLTLGGLSAIAGTGSTDYVALAALLAVLVGALRILIGLLRWGSIAYLMSQPVVAAFTVAAALLILFSQVPALLDVPSEHSSPLLSAAGALRRAAEWSLPSAGIGVAMIGLILLGRRLSPLFPGAFLGTVAALALSALGALAVTEVGEVPSGLPAPDLGLPWAQVPALLLPALVIALVGFAEAASIARHYAAEDRESWKPDREFIGQGLANVAAGAFGGYPAGGSFSRSSLNRLSGARTRWSGVLTGVVVLAVMPVASILSSLPKSALAGLVIASVVPLLKVRPILELWRFSRPQFFVSLITFAATLASAPHVERGVLIGVGLSLAVHLWRELQVDVDTWTEAGALHVRPQGVLYFGSAPALESRVDELVAADPALTMVVVHLERLGRLDVTGALALRSLIDDMTGSAIHVVLADPQPQARRVLQAVLGTGRLEVGRSPEVEHRPDVEGRPPGEHSGADARPGGCAHEGEVR